MYEQCRDADVSGVPDPMRLTITRSSAGRQLGVLEVHAGLKVLCVQLLCTVSSLWSQKKS